MDSDEWRGFSEITSAENYLLLHDRSSVQQVAWHAISEKSHRLDVEELGLLREVRNLLCQLESDEQREQWLNSADPSNSDI
jgi:hypothetical protein